MHHTSRGWQNILHVIGTCNSLVVILGAVLVGGQNYVIGITLMVIGAISTRILSELEFRKQYQMFSEFKHKV